MKLTFAAKTFAARTFRCATLAGPAVLGPYRPAAAETTPAGAKAGQHYQAGATTGACNG